MFTLELVLTEDCNMRCEYCFERRESTIYPIMSTDVLRAAILWAYEKCCTMGESLNILFFGGEPLLCMPKIKLAIDFLHEINKENVNAVFSISTNGTLLTKDIVKFFLKNNFILQISVDGPQRTQDLNRKMRNGKGSWDIVKSNCDSINLYCSQSKAPLTIKKIVTPNNVKTFAEDIIYLCRPNVVVSFDFNYEAEWTQEDYSTLYTQLDILISRYSEIICGGSEVREISSVVSGIVNQRMVYNAIYCGAGQTHFAIKPLGDIYPCSRFLHLPVYHIGNVLNNNSVEDKAKDLLEYNILQHKCAEKCSLFRFCNCKCPYINELYTGNIYEPSNLTCLMWKSIINLCLKYFESIQLAMV